jgi:uncharacterized protein YjiS (DUF1127 family)
MQNDRIIKPAQPEAIAWPPDVSASPRRRGAALWQAWRSWRERHRATALLRLLSPAALRDIGLAPDDPRLLRWDPLWERYR